MSLSATLSICARVRLRSDCCESPAAPDATPPMLRYGFRSIKNIEGHLKHLAKEFETINELVTKGEAGGFTDSPAPQPQENLIHRVLVMG